LQPLQNDLVPGQSNNLTYLRISNIQSSAVATTGNKIQPKVLLIDWHQDDRKLMVYV
jgi:hypothetical protein